MKALKNIEMTEVRRGEGGGGGGGGGGWQMTCNPSISSYVMAFQHMTMTQGFSIYLSTRTRSVFWYQMPTSDSPSSVTRTQAHASTHTLTRASTHTGTHKHTHTHMHIHPKYPHLSSSPLMLGGLLSVRWFESGRTFRMDLFLFCYFLFLLQFSSSKSLKSKFEALLFVFFFFF